LTIARGRRKKSLEFRDRAHPLWELSRAIVVFRAADSIAAQFARAIEKIFDQSKNIFLDADICKDMTGTSQGHP